MGERKAFSPMAWVGSITAVFSLIGAVYGGWSFFSGQLEKRRAIERLLAAEARQLRAADYEAAWKTLGQAAGIDPGSAAVQAAQEDVAMQWLDHIHVSGDQTFSSITEKLEPVLTRGATASASTQRQADLLAHLGWSYFLRRRESPSGPDPESAYREALTKDPANPYAHAMWGHWILWNRQGIAKANEHFNAALATTRPGLRAFVRTLQLSALGNDRSPEAGDEAIHVATDMRKERADLDAHAARSILNLYQERLIPPSDATAAFLGAAAQDHLDTFEWLLKGAASDDRASLSNAYVRCALLEAAGRHTEALEGYRGVQARLGAGAAGTLPGLVRTAVARLR